MDVDERRERPARDDDDPVARVERPRGRHEARRRWSFGCARARVDPGLPSSPWSSWYTNQMNIGTNGSREAIEIDCRMYAACFAYGMPSAAWCPYSVIQIGTDLRSDNLFSSVSKRGSRASDTFGHLTRWLGGKLGLDGYGWCDQASNLRRGFASRRAGRTSQGSGLDGARSLVAPAWRGLADRDLRRPISCLDARVGGRCELRVVRRRDRPARRVELRREEVLEVRLVPDRPEPHERESLEAARVAGRDGTREAGEVRDSPGHHVRVLAAVRPPRRPERVRMTSWSFSCAARTASSMSSKLYAGSKELAALDGRVFAVTFHWIRA